MSSFAGTNSRCFTTFSIDCSPHTARLKGAAGPSSGTPVPSLLARFVMTPGARAGINLSVFTALHIDCWIESLQYILCTINVHMHLILSLSSSYWLHAGLINNSLLLWGNKRNIFCLWNKTWSQFKLYCIVRNILRCVSVMRCCILYIGGNCHLISYSLLSTPTTIQQKKELIKYEG